ncbi:polymer-forming cytoskeletal protein [Comamonas sp. w2-DMI]|uniref:bactofilin family protein n=1 Tax=Comamonas sp. w2-DMI TaxID=3126391 RepID=UPI0032E39ECA
MKFIERMFGAFRRKRAQIVESRAVAVELEEAVPSEPLTNQLNLDTREKERISPFPQPKPTDTVIAGDAVMLGTLKVGGRVIIEGRVSGQITEMASGANVYVDEQAVVRGEVHASNALVYGEVEGAITASAIAIEQTAKVAAQIEYRNIRIRGGLSGARLVRNPALRELREDQDTQQRLLAR